MNDVPSEQDISARLARLKLSAGQNQDRVTDVSLDEIDRQLNAMRTELTALGDVSSAKIEQTDWAAKARAYQAEQQPKTSSAWLTRWPVAMAASVFFVSAVGMYVLFATPKEQEVPAFAETTLDPGYQLAQLMTRSKELERAMGGAGRLSTAADTSAIDQGVQLANVRAQRSLRYRLADLDTQIANLYDAQVMDEQRRLDLWALRVQVLESLYLTTASESPSGERLAQPYSRSM